MAKAGLAKLNMNLAANSMKKAAASTLSNTQGQLACLMVLKLNVQINPYLMSNQQIVTIYKKQGMIYLDKRKFITIYQCLKQMNRK